MAEMVISYEELAKKYIALVEQVLKAGHWSVFDAPEMDGFLALAEELFKQYGERPKDWKIYTSIGRVRINEAAVAKITMGERITSKACYKCQNTGQVWVETNSYDGRGEYVDCDCIEYYQKRDKKPEVNPHSPGGKYYYK